MLSLLDEELERNDDLAYDRSRPDRGMSYDVGVTGADLRPTDGTRMPGTLFKALLMLMAVLVAPCGAAWADEFVSPNTERDARAAALAELAYRVGESSLKTEAERAFAGKLELLTSVDETAGKG